jgi:hypothetical protein
MDVIRHQAVRDNPPLEVDRYFFEEREVVLVVGVVPEDLLLAVAAAPDVPHPF